MSVLAEFEVPSTEFVLADTLTAAPSMRIEIKRVVGGETFVTPYFWAAGGDFDAFEQALRDDEGIREVLILEEDTEETGDGGTEERFYRVQWESTVPNLISAVSDASASILEALSEDGSHWDVKVLFAEDRDLTKFHEYCQEHDFDVEPTRVYHPRHPQERAEYGVTEDQQEALVAAYHAGYFAVPRDVTLTELAGQLDLSRNALSARLRRGHHSLVEHTLVHEK